MTTPNQPQQPVPPIDPGNTLLAETPAQLVTGLIQTAQGQRLALTIRTASTTFTVLLGQADGRTWGRNIIQTADAMSASGLIVAGPGMQLGNGQQQHPGA